MSSGRSSCSHYRSRSMRGPPPVPGSYARPVTSSSHDGPAPVLPPAIRLLGLRETALDPAEVLAAVEDPTAGGLNLFVGIVRDHDGGASVDHLDYTAHPSALTRLQEVAVEVAEEFEVVATRSGASHRAPGDRRHRRTSRGGVRGPPRPGLRRLAGDDRPAQGARARVEAPGLRRRPRRVGATLPSPGVLVAGRDLPPRRPSGRGDPAVAAAVCDRDPPRHALGRLARPARDPSPDRSDAAQERFAAAIMRDLPREVTDR